MEGEGHLKELQTSINFYQILEFLVITSTSIIVQNLIVNQLCRSF